MKNEEKGARIYDRYGIRGSHQTAISDRRAMAQKGTCSRSSGNRTGNVKVVADTHGRRRNVCTAEARPAEERGGEEERGREMTETYTTDPPNEFIDRLLQELL